MRNSRLDQPPRAAQRTTAAASNTLSVRPSSYKTSRSLSPRHSVSILRLLDMYQTRANKDCS